jgi:hypothetical protein
MSQIILIFLALIVISKCSLYIVSENNKEFNIGILNLSESEFYDNILLKQFIKSKQCIIEKRLDFKKLISSSTSTKKRRAKKKNGFYRIIIVID